MVNNCCLQIVAMLRRLPNEILFKIFYQCPKEYLPDALLNDNYFMNCWYREYYPYWYKQWKKANKIVYRTEKGAFNGRLVKRINGEMRGEWELACISSDNLELYKSINDEISILDDMVYFTNIKHLRGLQYHIGDDFYVHEKLTVTNNKCLQLVYFHDLDSENLLNMSILTPPCDSSYTVYSRKGIEINHDGLQKVTTTKDNLVSIFGKLSLEMEGMIDQYIDKITIIINNV